MIAVPNHIIIHILGEYSEHKYEDKRPYKVIKLFNELTLTVPQIYVTVIIIPFESASGRGYVSSTASA